MLYFFFFSHVDSKREKELGMMGKKWEEERLRLK